MKPQATKNPCGYLFNAIPNNAHGRRFIKTMRADLNREAFGRRILTNGPRRAAERIDGKFQGAYTSTLPQRHATHFRVYLEDHAARKFRGEVWNKVYVAEQQRDEARAALRFETDELECVRVQVMGLEQNLADAQREARSASDQRDTLINAQTENLRALADLATRYAAIPAWIRWLF